MVGGANEESEKEVDPGVREATSLDSRGRECFGRVGVLFVAVFCPLLDSHCPSWKSCERESCWKNCFMNNGRKGRK
jgi:hypothetical protein